MIITVHYLNYYVCTFTDGFIILCTHFIIIQAPIGNSQGDNAVRFTHARVCVFNHHSYYAYMLTTWHGCMRFMSLVHTCGDAMLAISCRSVFCGYHFPAD